MADTVVTDELKSLQKELSATQKERLVAPGNASERRSRNIDSNKTHFPHEGFAAAANVILLLRASKRLQRFYAARVQTHQRERLRRAPQTGPT